MQNRWLVHLNKIATLLLLLGTPLLGLSEERTKISLCFENTPNPPFYYGENSVAPHHPGLTVEALQEVAESLGVELDLQRMPWRRCILLLEKNQIDGAFEVSYKAKREEYAVYPRSEGALDHQRYLHSLSYYLYTLKDSGVMWDGSRIKNIDSTLVGVAGYSIVGDMRTDGYPVLEGVNQKANLEMLLKGRVAGLTQIASMTDSIIASSPSKFAGVKKHAIPLRSKLYYLVFSKGYIDANRKFAEQVWDALAALRKSGRYEEIAIKYAE